MTITVFARNFRGFKDINLNLDKNIFLIGDNSSGKTSVMHLISHVLNTELMGKPILDDRYNVGKYDFFSQYFDNENVTFGFLSSDSGGTSAKAITIKYAGKNELPTLIRCTTIDAGKRATFLMRGDEVLFKTSILSSDVSVSDIYSMHDESRGYTKLSRSKDKRKIKSSGDIMTAVLSAMSAAVENPKTFGSLKIVADAFPALVVPGGHHIGPVRDLPETFYAYKRTFKPSGSHFATMWHDLKGGCSDTIFSSIEKFGKESGLFDKIEVKKIAEKFEDSPLVVSVTRGNREFLIDQVGVGVSQIIPIIIESVYYANEKLEKNNDGEYMLLQQPELHLHPIAQAAMGEFMYDMSSSGLKYIVETHSDYIIDRFRANIRDSKGTDVSARVLYFENNENGNKFSTIDIDETGALVDPPENYKAFFVSELLRTMF